MFQYRHVVTAQFNTSSWGLNKISAIFKSFSCLEWQVSSFYSNFFEVCSQGFNWQLVCIGKTSGHKPLPEPMLLKIPEPGHQQLWYWHSSPGVRKFIYNTWTRSSLWLLKMCWHHTVPTGTALITKLGILFLKCSLYSYRYFWIFFCHSDDIIQICHDHLRY